MNNEWRKYYGVTNGTRITDWLDNRLNKKNTNIFNIPDQKKLKMKLQNFFRLFFQHGIPKKSTKFQKARDSLI